MHCWWLRNYVVEDVCSPLKTKDGILYTVRVREKKDERIRDGSRKRNR
jgi:hypothetical protein